MQEQPVDRVRQLSGILIEQPDGYAQQLLGSGQPVSQEQALSKPFPDPCIAVSRACLARTSAVYEAAAFYAAFASPPTNTSACLKNMVSPMPTRTQ